MSVLEPLAFNSLTSQLHKKSFKSQLGMLESLYGGTFKRFATLVPNV